MVAISGVQRFISESRSTADLYSGSALMSSLAKTMLSVVPDSSTLVLPSGGESHSGVPNRVVALADSGDGSGLAAAMAASVRSTWKNWLEAALPEIDADSRDTPGFPAIQWVVVPVDSDGYRIGWTRAQEALRARKRIKDFPGYHVRQEGICSLTGRWPAVMDSAARKRQHAARRGEALSAVSRVKRWYASEHGGRFQSTWSIASAPYRDAIIRIGEDEADVWDAVVDLNSAVESLRSAGDATTRAALRRGSGAVPGIARSEDDALKWLRDLEGAWCAPETWEPGALRRDHDLTSEPDPSLCRAGQKAADRLGIAARKAGIPPLSPYLAVLAQDADRMGEQFGTFPGAVDPVDWQRSVSEAMAALAGTQVREIESAYLGRVVYAGGDDLLALVPADRALMAARAANELFVFDKALSALLERPSASTAIVFFHATWPLQSAISAAHDLLADAKKRDRPGLGVVVLSRGGERARVVLPWRDRGTVPATPMIEHLQGLAEAISGPLSGRLAAGLEADREALAELSGDWLHRELTRRAFRHGIVAEKSQEAGRRLAALCTNAAADQGFADCAASVVVARFVAGQSRVAE